MKRFLLQITKELDTLNYSAWSLAKFGFLVGIILLLLGGLAYYHGKILTAVFVGAPGFLLFAFGASSPLSLRLVYRLWMALAYLLGGIISPIILGIIYYLLVSPIALVALLVKGNPLEKKTKEGSYWITRVDTFNPKSMERMF